MSKPLKASKIILQQKPEKGEYSILIGIELQRAGEIVGIYYPRYRDQLQLLKWSFYKENKRYPPPALGAMLLFNGIKDVLNGKHIPTILAITKTPKPHNLLPENWYLSGKLIRQSDLKHKDGYFR